MKTSTIRALQAAAIAAPLVLWWLLTAGSVVGPDVLPPLSDVARRMVELITSGAFWTSVGTTVRNAVVGLLLAFVIGVPAGLALGNSARAYRAARVLLDMGRSMPWFGLVPALILLLGAGPKLVIWMVFVAGVFPMIIQSSYGSRQIDATMTAAVRSYRVPTWVAWRRVIIPNATPYIGTGLRLVSVMAVMVAIGVETLVQVPGLGREIADSQQNGIIDQMYAYVIYAGFLGLGANRLSTAVEGYFLRWRPPNGATS